MTELDKNYKRTIKFRFKKKFGISLIVNIVEINSKPIFRSCREDGVKFTNDQWVWLSGFNTCYVSIKNSKPLGAAMAHRESIRKSFEDQKKTKKK